MDGQKKKPKVLLVVESCNPDWASVPLVGYNFYVAANEIADVTLVTHDRNRPALEARHGNDNIVFIEPKRSEKNYYNVVAWLTTFRGRTIWPLYHVLRYPMYAFFDRTVREQFGGKVDDGEYDLVHVLTPMMPRYPVALSKNCTQVPFLLGPVNGGVPFPKGFADRGRREFSQFNFFRNIGRWLIPNYEQTYKRANKILAGSEYTKGWIKNAFKLDERNLELVFENAVPDDFYSNGIAHLEALDLRAASPLKIVFSGRLVPYKGADMLVRAIAKVIAGGDTIELTIVGDGAEMTGLKKLVSKLGVTDQVTFTGWVKQEETRAYYAQADVFGFPSVREFGGAVVMEAMACGLPCVVVDNGGIGEYVDNSCGFKVSPVGEDYVVDKVAEALTVYAQDRTLLKRHSIAAFEKAQSFSWKAKSDQLSGIYNNLMDS